MPKPKIIPLKNLALLPRLTLSFLLMSILPLSLMLFIIYRLSTPLNQGLLRQTEILLILIILSLSSGYVMSRQMVINMVRMMRQAKAIANGDYESRLAYFENEDMNKLARYFNRITEELEAQIAELEESKRTVQKVLNVIGHALSSPERIDVILNLTLETIANALDAKTGIIWLADETRNKIKAFISYGMVPHGIELAFDEGVSGWVAKEGELLNLEKDESDFRFSEEERYGYLGHSCICAPMVFEKKIIGSLLIACKAGQRKFTQDDANLLGNLSAEISIAIQNGRLKENIEKNYLETVSALALAVEAKDKYSHGHSARVTEYVTKVAKELGLDEESIKTLRDSAVLHDLGKIGVKDSILLKETALTEEEMDIMQKHAVIGESILRPISSLFRVCYLVRHHHEREDGKGYPDGIRGEEMDLPLKILIVTDAFDAMISDRPYRKGLKKEEVFTELKKYAGTCFDKRVVDVFTRII